MSQKKPRAKNVRVRNLSDLKEILRRDETYEYKSAYIRFDSIVVLPQPRKTFQNIPPLAHDISHKGFASPMIVARFNRPRCKEYVDVINFTWRTNISVDDLPFCRERGQEAIYILIAGERRYRACRILKEDGCPVCHSDCNDGKKCQCVSKVFKDDKVEVRLCVGISPFAALYLQFSENTHMPVLPHEEAQAYDQLLKLIRRADKKFSLTQFARKVGRQPETIRKALRFCELPIAVRKLVEDGSIKYGIGVALAQLYEAGFKDNELIIWASRAVVECWSVKECSNYIARYLEETQSGQRSLFDIFKEEQRLQDQRQRIRRVVQVNTIRAVWFWIHYVKAVSRLYDQGLLGGENPMFSDRSPARVFLQLINVLDEMRLHLGKKLKEPERKKTMDVLIGVRKTAKQLTKADQPG